MSKDKENTKIISKETLIERIKDKNSTVSRQDIKCIINAFLEEIDQSLINGEEIRLVGHFALKTITQKARLAMNLSTNQKITVPAKRVPKIKFSNILKEAIKG
jgi:DNA-binding protein HU-beta